MTEIIMQPILWALVGFFLIQLLIYLLLFRRLAAARTVQADDAFTPPVSIIIAAKNEEAQLLKNLPMVLGQNYPQFEAIVVDDQSEDETPQLLEAMEKQYPNLKVITIKEHIKDYVGKKLALTLGIKAAKHDMILLTDADCEPQSENWIRQMVSSYSDEKKEIVLGYSPYRKGPGLLNLIVRFDTFYTALQYLSYALWKRPYMGVGRNLSYRKELFFKNKGFAPYLKIASGDDDLFVNGNATKTNTAIEIHPDAFTLTEPKESWNEWLKQKRRHQQAGKLYKPRHKRMLFLLWLWNALFFAAFILGLMFIKPVWIPLGIYGIRLIVQMIVLYIIMKKLRVLELLPFVPVMEVVYQFILLPLISLLSLRTPKRAKW